MRPVIGCCVWSLIMDALVCWEHPTCDALDRLRPLRAAPAAPCMVTGFPPHSQHELMILWLWHCAPLLQISVDECGFGWNTDQICYNDWVLWSGYSCTNKLSLLLIVFPYLFSRECLQNTQDVLFFFFSRFSCLKILLSHHRLSAA